jgi:lipopolysaccharide transport system permease protein
MSRSQSFSSVQYSPQSPLQRPRHFFQEMVSDLGASRELAWRLLVHNLRAEYRLSALKYLWLFFPPLATALIWILLRTARIVTFQDIGIPYPVYIITGIFLWQGFLKMLNMPLQQMTSSRQLLTHLKFPWEALLLAGIGQALFEFVMYLVLLIPLYLVYQVPLHPTVLPGLVGIIALLAFGLALGLLLLPWGMLYDDVHRGLNIITMMMFFLIPIVYTTPTTFPGTLLVHLNPIAILLVTSRDWLTVGHAVDIIPFVLIALTVLPLLVLGWIVYRLAAPHLIARLGN